MVIFSPYLSWLLASYKSYTIYSLSAALLCRHASFMLPYKRGQLKEYAEEAWASASLGFGQKQRSEVTAIVMGRHSR